MCRLELLIACGITGMSGLKKARQGTVVDRKRQYRKTILADRVLPRRQRMSSKEIHREIKARSQQVLLHRSTSPSAKMVALSRQLTSARLPDLPLGISADPDRESTLTQKVKSELNLRDLHNADSFQSLPEAVISSTAKHTREEIDSKTDLMINDGAECDAFVALRELSALVARRKGLEIPDFVNGLMALLPSENAVKTVVEPSVCTGDTHSLVAGKDGRVHSNIMTPRPPPRRLQSHLQQDFDQRRRRQFPFEPGDDHIRTLEVDPKAYDARSQTDSTDSESSSWSASQPFAENHKAEDGDSIPLLLPLSAGLLKPSMMPSPVQTMGRVRRENSMSSLQSVFVKNAQDDRHNSRTSTQAAFRETSSADASIKSKSRSSSNNNPRAAESPWGSKERQTTLTNRHSTAALAAARVAETRGGNASRSSTQPSAATASSCK